MTRVALIRHGPTDWNEARRLQGRHDRPLSDSGRLEVGRWQVPDEVAGFDWVASPMIRAVETARLLGAPSDLATDPRLVEMDWGHWEGHTLDELRSRLGEAARANEARGLDFRPYRGESPREVQARVRDWLGEVATRRQPTLAIVHKGIIRATYALATGWDMMGKPPEKLAWAAAHIFDLAEDGRPSIARLNISLTSP